MIDITLNDYQKAAAVTAVWRSEKPAAMEGFGWVAYCALGLNGEAGEVAEKVKKVLRGDTEHGYEIDRGIAEEIGDTLWYLAMLAQELGFTLQEIADINIAKLASRQQRGVLKGSGDSR